MDEQTKKNAPKESTIKGRKRGALFIVLAIALFSERRRLMPI